MGSLKTTLWLYPSHSRLDLMQFLHLGLFSSHLMRRLRQALRRLGADRRVREARGGSGSRRKLTEAASLGSLLHHRFLALGVFLVIVMLERWCLVRTTRLWGRGRAGSLGHGQLGEETRRPLGSCTWENVPVDFARLFTLRKGPKSASMEPRFPLPCELTDGRARRRKRSGDEPAGPEQRRARAAGAKVAGETRRLKQWLPARRTTEGRETLAV